MLASGTPFSVYDPAGKRMLSGKTEGTETAIRLDRLEAGCYFLHIDGVESPLKIVRE
jgi:hypothetical protein